MRPRGYRDIDLTTSRLATPVSGSLEKLVGSDSHDSSKVKTRSGLATAAGFAGLALIFSRFSVAPLIWNQFPRIFDVNNPHDAFLSTIFLLSIPVPGLVAPVALWLGAKAWLNLDGNSGTFSKIQAGFGLVIGLVGTAILISEIYQVVNALMNPI